jgi:hypothetical protein
VVRSAIQFHCILFNDLFAYCTRTGHEGKSDEKFKVEGVVHLASVRHMERNKHVSEMKAEDAVHIIHICSSSFAWYMNSFCLNSFPIC